MGEYTKTNTREDFVSYLKNNNINDELIERLLKLPEEIDVKGYMYKLNINTSWDDESNTHNNFELNYYSNETLEFLLPYKIINDFEVSLNVIECQLLNMDLISGKIDCEE